MLVRPFVCDQVVDKIIFLSRTGGGRELVASVVMVLVAAALTCGGCTD